MIDSQRNAVRPRGGWLLLALLLIGLLVAGSLAWVMLGFERARVTTDFRAKAGEHAEALERGWKSEFRAVEYLANVFVASNRVTREEFRVVSERLLERHPTIRALEWVPRVTHAERAAFVAAIRETIPDFELVDLNGRGKLVPIDHRPVYFPVLYVEPMPANRRALGYDAAGNTAGNRALVRAIEQAALTVSAPTDIVQDERAALALLVFSPVYRAGPVPAEPAARREAVIGLTEGVYMADALMARALSALESRGIETVVHALTGHDRTLLARHHSAGPSDSPWYAWGSPPPATDTWSVGGRSFVVTVRAQGPPYVYDLRAPLAVFVLAVLLTGSLTAFVRLLMGNERRMRALADERGLQLDHHATYDPLTGLFNRTTFEARLERAVQRCRASGTAYSLCYLDIDEFKLVNDLHGHRAGDDLLRQVGARLAAARRPDDTLARLGGDEFALLLANTGAEAAREIAHGILHSVDGYRFRSNGHSLAVTFSIGVSEINHHTHGVGMALGSADAACNIAKEQGRSRVHVFRSGDVDSDEYRSQMLWATELRDGLDAGRLELHGQRIVASDPASGLREMMELLVRLRDRRGDLVSPGAFIPAGERYNLMPSVDRWVIEHGIALKARRASDDAIWCINLSGHSLNEDGFFEHIRDSLRRHSVPPQSLCFEVTETAVIRSLSRAEGFVNRLRSMGCRVALDDFGSGMSSFTYLKHLPVDFLKIDGAFIRDLHTDRMDHAMVSAIQRIAAELGIRTIAEYVETEAVREEVRALGVDYVQGFHIDRPAPLEG